MVYRGEYHFLPAMLNQSLGGCLSARCAVRLPECSASGSCITHAGCRARRIPHRRGLPRRGLPARARLPLRVSPTLARDVSRRGPGSCTVRFASASLDAEPAALAGLAASTKYNAALVGCCRCCFCDRPRPRGSGRLMLRDSGGCGVRLGWLSNRDGVRCPRPCHLHRRHPRHRGRASPADTGRMSARNVHLTSSLRYGLGLPLLLTGLAGLVHLLVRRPREGLLLATPSPTTR